MSTLVRWNPVREMMDLRRGFDRLFESALDMPGFGSESVATWGLALDLVEKDDAFVVKASVPGINPDDLEITLAENTLSIGGEFKEDNEINENQYRMRERRVGSFCRSVTLPSQVDREAIEASYDAGILTLNIPKTEEVKPKRIAVQVQKERKTLEG